MVEAGIYTRFYLNDLAREVHDIAVSKGFYENPKSFIEAVYLIADECHEAGREFITKHDENIPEELADVLIRLLDTWTYYCPGSDIDAVIRAKMDKNKTRPKLHGKRL